MLLSVISTQQTFLEKSSADIFVFTFYAKNGKSDVCHPPLSLSLSLSLSLCSKGTYVCIYFHAQLRIERIEYSESTSLPTSFNVYNVFVNDAREMEYQSDIN